MKIRNLWTVWGAFLASQVMYAGLAFELAPPRGSVPTSPPWVFPLVAVFPGALALLWGRVIAVEQRSDAKWYVRWALVEAVALLALLAATTGGPTAIVAPMFAIGWGLMISQVPRDA